MSLSFAGVLATFIASLLIYLASPHQALLHKPFAARPARLFALLLLMGGQACLLASMHTLAAVFSLVTLLMLFLIALPYLGAQRQRRAARKAAP